MYSIRQANGDILISWGADGYLRLSPGRARKRIMHALECHVGQHAPHIVHSSATNERLRRRFGLPASEHLVNDFRCVFLRRRTPIWGKLYLFAEHLCFFGRSFRRRPAAKYRL